ncbi:Uncharacterised protein [Serratia ficaria]|jgi:hypothetical protein|uniref:hypothetical protein n=1 Tax=Serratia ficaria TaxID=61651 RepID=UPI00217ABB76|nr:hypothetical protein [Serratia ficaria]CAI1181503.1 Uncharacterised protein [Serratia ficaria]CAI1511441.1 Uncharacterised protein [Serratia ficaria]CAI2420173.1 Uncharacterised protein [Serratia ficaria]CAI2497444.1 Uncharacterised protein [Serratia ficaria]CAI2515418.1 Uncharacterised protein [Serratia ficaria]
MKTLIIDVIGLAGLGLLVGGIYLQFGTATALQSAGAALLVFALIAARRGKT